MKYGVYLWDGMTLEDDVFVRPPVILTKDLRPGIAGVLTSDAPAHALVYGNPARFQRWIDRLGRDLIQEDAPMFGDP